MLVDVVYYIYTLNKIDGNITVYNVILWYHVHIMYKIINCFTEINL